MIKKITNLKKDKRIFRKVANRSNVKNHLTPRGGIRF